MTGPVLVRHPDDVIEARPAHSRLFWVRLVLLLIGIAALGVYGCSIAGEHIYQDYQNWAFDQQIAGRPPVAFLDYVREATPLGLVIGRGSPPPSAPVTKAAEGETHTPPPLHGSVLGRVQVPRLGISAMVREGVDAQVLSNAVGHVPTTALAGASGNFAIAAHRDTIFRALKDIQNGDLVTFQSPAGTYTYRIVSMRIVKPSEVSVLRPDGGLPGAQIREISTGGTRPELITLITCYPFYFVGSAPKRFIVQGQLVSESVAPESASPPPKRTPPPRSRPRQTARTVKKPRVNRGSFHIQPASAKVAPNPPKKRRFWKRLLHVS